MSVIAYEALSRVVISNCWGFCLLGGLGWSRGSRVVYLLEIEEFALRNIPGMISTTIGINCLRQYRSPAYMAIRTHKHVGAKPNEQNLSAA
jgi:hypothetical protein